MYNHHIFLDLEKYLGCFIIIGVMAIRKNKIGI